MNYSISTQDTTPPFRIFRNNTIVRTTIPDYDAIIKAAELHKRLQDLKFVEEIDQLLNEEAVTKE